MLGRVKYVKFDGIKEYFYKGFFYILFFGFNIIFI